MISKRQLISMALLGTLMACATPGEKPPSSQATASRRHPHRRPPHGTSAPVQVMDSSQEPNLDSSPDAREYEAIRKLYVAQQYDSTISTSRAFESAYPASPYRSAVENIHGLALLMIRDTNGAIEHFKKAIERNRRNPNNNAFLLYNLAKAEFSAGRLDDSDRTLNQVNVSVLDPENIIKFHFLKSSIYFKRHFQYESARELLSASRLLGQVPNPGEMRKSLETALDQSLEDVTGTAPIEDLYKEFEDAPLADLLLFRLGAKELNLGESGKGEMHLRLLGARYPNSAYVSRADSMLRSWQDQTIIDRKAVGVLLPMKGKFATFGARNLQAIELAFHIFGPEETDDGISLVIEDSGEEPDQAIKALDRLVMKHHVAAVIGPLLSKGMDQITQRAEELGVPAISLARHAVSGTNYVIQGGLTLQLQAYSIARYAIEELRLKNFAMLTPKDKVGQEIGQYFWDAVEGMGGRITGAETYDPDETDFRQAVDKLSGLYYTDSRSRELQKLAELRAQDQIKKKTRKTEKYFNLPPIVDYQAVFIPDGPKVAGQILPTFAYRDVDHVQFLGTAEWNSPDLYTRAQNFAEGVLFVDAFFPQSASTRVRRFVELYQETFGQDPSEMDAMAYDAAGVLKAALAGAGRAFTRSDLLERVKKTDGFKGVTGQITFRNGQLLRDLKVLTIHGGQIVETK